MKQIDVEYIDDLIVVKIPSKGESLVFTLPYYQAETLSFKLQSALMDRMTQNSK